MIEVHYHLVDLIERVKATNINYYTDTSELVSPFLNLEGLDMLFTAAGLENF